MKQPTRNSSAATTSKTTPCCTKIGLKKGPWTPEEDEILSKYIKKEGEGKWRTLPKKAGLLRCGKSCRLRWMNYLRPSVKRGHIAPDEEDLILRLHRLLGNRWALIAGRIPGRTDNEIKNYWNTHLSKKLISQGIDPRTHKPLNPNPRLPLPTSTPRLLVKNGSRNAVSTENGTERGKAHLEGDHDWLNSNGFVMNLQSNSEKEDTGFCSDEIFSSFLDSLMNGDMLLNQQQHKQHNVRPSPTYENGASSSRSVLGYDAAWDATMSSSSSATFDQQDDCREGNR